MRNWHFIIPIIAVAVWILSSLIRGAEEQRVRRPRPQRDPEEPADGTRPRRSPSEIDRFLQEVQRRRQEGEERRPPREAPKPLPPAEEVLVAIPVQEVPNRRTPRADRPRRRPAESRPIPVAQPVPVVPPPVLETQFRESPPPPGPEAASQPTAAEKKREAMGKQLRELLNSKQSLATAFILREVFDRPLSLRRGG